MLSISTLKHSSFGLGEVQGFWSGRNCRKPFWRDWSVWRFWTPGPMPQKAVCLTHWAKRRCRRIYSPFSGRIDWSRPAHAMRANFHAFLWLIKSELQYTLSSGGSEYKDRYNDAKEMFNARRDIHRKTWSWVIDCIACLDCEQQFHTPLHLMIHSSNMSLEFWTKGRSIHRE